MKCMPLCALTRTFQETIHVTRRLGFAKVHLNRRSPHHPRLAGRLELKSAKMRAIFAGAVEDKSSTSSSGNTISPPERTPSWTWARLDGKTYYVERMAAVKLPLPRLLRINIALVHAPMRHRLLVDDWYCFPGLAAAPSWAEERTVDATWTS